MKVAIVTGASKGIGAAISTALAKEGYSLILSDIDKVKLKEFTKETKKLTKCFSIVCDIRKKKNCQKTIDFALKKFGRIDLLVNNAGIWDSSTIGNLDENTLSNVFQTNVFGTMFMSQVAVKVMKEQKSGHILNIGSTAGVDYKTSLIIYGTSKHAVVGFTGCLREELKDSGIRVSICSPGGTKTDIYNKFPEYDTSKFMETSYVAEKILEHIKNPESEWHCVIRRPQ
jgi:meso-butanediol dehydrogenase/(S,S)-butanediol dehydrogenase/diacetyl reductase